MTSPAPLVSVVIPCRNAASALPGQLEALARQTYAGSFEVIVADNGSDDDSAAIAEDMGAIVVHARSGRGPNYARNAGAAAANGELILLCDADDVVDDGWIAAMVDGLSRYDVVGGPLDRSRLNDVDPNWTEPRSLDEPVFGFLPASAGANTGIRAEALRAIGGWDEAFAGGPDDVDFSWRAQIHGLTLGFEPKAVVHYRLRTSAWAVARQTYDRASYMPMLFRRYDLPALRAGSRWSKAVRYVSFSVLAWPAAVVSKRWRREWARRVAFALGFARGMLRPTPEPILGLARRPGRREVEAE